RLFPQKQGATGATVLELRNVSYRNAVRDISFELKSGEILGIAGLVGSGRTELALTMFGITPPTAGELLLDGKPVAITGPEKARELGIASITDEPTRGIDVDANAEIHLLMRELAGEGMAILMISSELPEVLGMSERVLVMSGGRIAARLDRGEVTAEAVGAAMVKGRAEAEAAW